MSTLFGELAGNDAYELLDVPPDASADEIQRAWREQASAHHPDRVTDPAAKAAAEDRLRLINAARDVLTTRRTAYDAARTEPGTPDAEEIIDDDPWATAAPDDPWEGASPGRRPPPPPRYRGPQYRARNGPGTRFAIGCGIFFAICWVLFLGTVVVIAFQPDGPKPEASVPDDLTGTWAGTVKQVAGDRSSWDVEMTLEEGLNLGEVRYLEGKCTGTAVPVADNGKTLTVETDFPDDKSECDVGACTSRHARTAKPTSSITRRTERKPRRVPSAAVDRADAPAATRHGSGA
ncbi:hypothetical protein BJF79_12540 [Actinomadura sp. CNU-125]|uniref:J domain-containing protein n=1 Tax=Actinomadura sp. CNU-125 TaxID=1904961 RepID=UPI0009624588|nr:J domain-containing protein [Actinomadura sp. CNU-125]OLT25947.1 hypothetical protein BJF79_12540 [Actinomadura sp. CNU-125]